MVGKINIAIQDGVNRARSFHAAIISWVSQKQKLLDDEEISAYLKAAVFNISIRFSLPVPLNASRLLSRRLNETTATVEDMRGVWALNGALSLRIKWNLAQSIPQNGKYSKFGYLFFFLVFVE